MRKPKVFSFTFLILLLTACIPGAATPSAPTVASLPPTASPAPSQTPSPTVLPSPTAIPQFPLDGYVMVFSEDENLYFQDGNSQPVQLTKGEKTDFIALSDDNQKVMFSRGETPNQTFYSVNVDGSGEQALITPEWLTRLGDGTTPRFPTFAPNTHQILFNARLCEIKEDTKVCSIGLYRVDADTGKTRELMAPGSPVQYEEQNSNFKISPDGSKVSVVSSGHLDILDMDGNFVSQNILAYTPSAPTELVPVQHWLPDSSGLIVTIFDAIHVSAPIPPTQYTVWRYEIGRDAVQVYLTPHPILIYLEPQVSPDGKWLFYEGSEPGKYALYLGNLSDGHTQFYAESIDPGKIIWSRDSKYFSYGYHWIGSVDGKSIAIGGIFLDWIDDARFSYVPSLPPQVTIGEIVDGRVLSYDLSREYFLIRPKD